VEIICVIATRGNNTEEIMRSYLVLPALILAATFASAQAGPTARAPDGGMLLAQAKPIQPNTDETKNSAEPSKATRGTTGMRTSASHKKKMGAKSRKVAKKSKMKKAHRS
jgi:hypothetical protein